MTRRLAFKDTPKQQMCRGASACCHPAPVHWRPLGGGGGGRGRPLGESERYQRALTHPHASARHHRVGRASRLAVLPSIGLVSAGRPSCEAKPSPSTPPPPGLAVRLNLAPSAALCAPHAAVSSKIIPILCDNTRRTRLGHSASRTYVCGSAADSHRLASHKQWSHHREGGGLRPLPVPLSLTRPVTHPSAIG